MKKTIQSLVGPALAAALLSGCSKSDELRTKQKAHEAGQEIKQELSKAGDEIKKGAHEAKEEIKKGVNEAKKEIKEGLGGADKPHRPKR